MATKKQKRAAGIAKKAQEFTETRERGLKLQKADQERRFEEYRQAMIARDLNDHRRKTKGAHATPADIRHVEHEANRDGLGIYGYSTPTLLGIAEQARRGVEALMVAMSYEDDDTSTMLDAGCGLGE